nr:MAG TPA: hypothetical protein [Crassvirales sp.]
MGTFSLKSMFRVIDYQSSFITCKINHDLISSY